MSCGKCFPRRSALDLSFFSLRRRSILSRATSISAFLKLDFFSSFNSARAFFFFLSFFDLLSFSGASLDGDAAWYDCCSGFAGGVDSTVRETGRAYHGYGTHPASTTLHESRPPHLGVIQSMDESKALVKVRITRPVRSAATFAILFFPFPLSHGIDQPTTPASLSQSYFYFLVLLLPFFFLEEVDVFHSGGRLLKVTVKRECHRRSGWVQCERVFSEDSF